MADADEITRLLAELRQARSEGASAVLERLMPLVYRELKALARSSRYRWRGAPSLGTTSLVHEAYLKLERAGASDLESRRQFFCLASSAMRSILIDNARWHQRAKRGGAVRDVPLEGVGLVSAQRSEELLALESALLSLESSQPELARVVDCRIFGGLSVEETAQALEVSPATIKRRWSVAKSWLYRELGGHWS